MADDEETEEAKFNRYASQKSVSQNLLNTSIIQSHIGLLVFVYSDGGDLSGFEATTVVLVVLSIILQSTTPFMLTWLFYIRPGYQWKCFTAEVVNGLVTALSGVALMLNIAITAVSLELKPASEEDSG